MDLYAYGQVEDLEPIAKANGIDIPRLRGYRLMKDEESVSQEKINELKKECEIPEVEWLCCARPIWRANADFHIGDEESDILKDYYLIKEKDKDGNDRYVGIRWDRIHGRKRKILKFEIKKQKRKIQEQFDTWNKYVGREDVLYIHSRMGGANWKYYENKESITSQPWFLDRVDDHWDSTYCDFYAKIKVNTTEEENGKE